MRFRNIRIVLRNLASILYNPQKSNKAGQMKNVIEFAASEVNVAEICYNNLKGILPM